jgi:dolichyl-phosphate-mannose--protein O-mannosyl transferase
MACNKDPTAPFVYFLSHQLDPSKAKVAYQLAEVARGIRCSSGMTDSSKFFLLKTPGFSWASTAWALSLSFVLWQVVGSLRDGIDIDITTDVSRQITYRISSGR